MSTEQGTNVWLFLDMLARRRALIISVVVLITLASVAVALFMPSWYRAEATLMPPKDNPTGLAGATQVSDLLSFTEGLTLPVMVTPSDLYARVLKSRSLAEKIIARFDLHQRYNTPGETATYLTLMSHAEFRVTDEGLLLLAVEDRDPVVAAAITNAFIEELNQLNRDIVAHRADQNDDYVSDRFDQVKAELQSARQALEEFQTRHKAVNFSEQMRLAVEQAIQLKVSLAQLDLDIQMSEQVLSAENPQLKQNKRRRELIREQLHQLEEGGTDSSYFSVPVSAIPELQGRYEDLYSRVQVNERLYTILLEQKEHSRIARLGNVPTVSVLDSARVPEFRDRPKRTRIVVASFAFGLILAILLAAVIDFLARLKRVSPDDHARFSRFIRAFFGFLPGLGSGPRK